MSDDFKSYRCQSGFSSPPCYAAGVERMWGYQKFLI